jgi:hypothetical protein
MTDTRSHETSTGHPDLFDWLLAPGRVRSSAPLSDATHFFVSRVNSLSKRTDP